jgi:hypothetical protein
MVTLFLVAIAAVVGNAILVVLLNGTQSDLQQLRGSVIQNCLSTLQFTAKTAQAREAQLQWFEENEADERTNQFIDQTLRDKRVAADEQVIAKLQAVLDHPVNINCAAYSR